MHVSLADGVVADRVGGLLLGQAPGWPRQHREQAALQGRSYHLCMGAMQRLPVRCYVAICTCSQVVCSPTACTDSHAMPLTVLPMRVWVVDGYLNQVPVLAVPGEDMAPTTAADNFQAA